MSKGLFTAHKLNSTLQTGLRGLELVRRKHSH